MYIKEFWEFNTVGGGRSACDGLVSHQGGRGVEDKQTPTLWYKRKPEIRSLSSSTDNTFYQSWRKNKFHFKHDCIIQKGDLLMF